MIFASPKKETPFFLCPKVKSTKHQWGKTCGEVPYHKLFYGTLRFTCFISITFFMQQPRSVENFHLTTETPKRQGACLCSGLVLAMVMSLWLFGGLAVEHRFSSPFPFLRVNHRNRSSQCRGPGDVCSNQVEAYYPVILRILQLFSSPISREIDHP